MSPTAVAYDRSNPLERGPPVLTHSEPAASLLIAIRSSLVGSSLGKSPQLSQGSTDGSTPAWLRRSPLRDDPSIILRGVAGSAQ